jgi:hypothetical protein
MKRLWAICLLLLPVIGKGQLGGYVGYGMSSAPAWQMELLGVGRAEPPGKGGFMGLEYELPIAKLRMALVPGLQLARLSTPEIVGVHTRSSWYSALLQWRIYPMDIRGDCNCPTFSRKGSIIKKGLWMGAAAGLTAMDNRIMFDQLQGVRIQRSLSYQAVLTAGLDLGLSDHLGVSPFIALTYFPKVSWTALSTLMAPEILATPPSENSKIMMIQLGITTKIQLK